MIKNHLLKSASLLVAVMFISLYSYPALAMPGWLCIASTVEPDRNSYTGKTLFHEHNDRLYIHAHKMRLRARVVYIDKGKHRQKGDIYPGYTKYYFNPVHYDALHGDNGVCLKTYELIKLFKKKFGNNTDNYYLKEVRIDIKGERDCHPSGEDSSQPWMTAPTRGVVLFDLYANKLSNPSASVTCSIPTDWDTSDLDPSTVTGLQ